MTDLLDFRELKRGAIRLLPREHPVRMALQREPDFLPGPEARAKLAAYARLLLTNREGGGR